MWTMAALSASFGLMLTAHLLVAGGLFAREPRWRGLVVLIPVLGFLAPFWAYRCGMRVRAYAWGLGASSYAICLATAVWQTP